MPFEDSARLPDEPVPHPGDSQSFDMQAFASKLPVSRAALVAALVCASLCVILMRAGFLSLSVFSLVPLGICCVVYGYAAGWLSFLIFVISYSLLSLGIFLRLGGGLGNTGMAMVYNITLALGFTWIMAGRLLVPRLRTLYRFIIAAIAVALVSSIMIFQVSGNERFYVLLHSFLEQITPYASYGAAQQAYLDQFLNPDYFIGLFFLIYYRGGALVSAFLILFFSRQITFFFARLFWRRNPVQNGPLPSGDLIGFYAPPRTIWIFSLCLPVIFLCGKAAVLQPVEIAAWNVLVICTIMFLAQGGGIVLFSFARRFKSRITRLVFTLLVVFALFIPGLNAMVLGGLVLLGIVETWLPLRRKGVESRE